MHHDVVIIGTGSGNAVIDDTFADLDVGLIEERRAGGTCLNYGCIPSKMLVFSADVTDIVATSGRFNVDAESYGLRWTALRDRVFGVTDAHSHEGRKGREDSDNITFHQGHAEFTGPRQLRVTGEDGTSVDITAGQIVIANGSRPVIPPVVEASGLPYETSDTIMRIDALPEHLIVIGGGYIAAELAHVFGALGSRVTIVARGDTMLRFEDDDIRMRFTELYRRRFEVLCTTQVLAARTLAGNGDRDEIEIDVSVDGEHRSLRGDALLVATGRIPNGDELRVADTGVEVDGHGYVVTDEHLRTTAPGIWALGDICNPAMLKHAANADARVVAHNTVHPQDLRTIDRRFLPHAVFGYPQVVSVGPTERQLLHDAVPIAVAVRSFGSAAYGWAMEDTESICKLIAHRDTRQLLAAHIVGPQAATLLQQLVQGMRFGITVDQMARDQYYIHPALTEVVEQALLDL